MTTSGMVLVAACIVVAIWDLIAASQFGVQYTVSWYIRDQAMCHPTLIFAMGYLCAHFLSAMNPPPSAP